MKRGWLFFLIVLIAIPFVFASVSVTLVAPPGTFTSSTITLNCTGSVTNYSEDGNLGSNADLLISTGTPELNQTISSVAGTSYSASFTVYNVPNGNYNWNCRFYNQSSGNSVNATGAQGTFSVSSNNAPSFTGTIPNQNFAEDGSLSNSFDLDSYFSDASTLTYSVSGNSSIKVTIASDGQVSFSSTGNVSFNETIYFVASDGSLTNRSNNVVVNVYSVNDAPYLKWPIPSQNLTKNTNKTITLSDYFADVEGDSLNYSVTTSPSNVNITISGSTATLSPASNWTGATTIVFAANDSKNQTNGNIVNINVGTGTNTAPIITDYSPSTSTVNMKTKESRTFSIVKSDADENNLSVQWYLNDQAISGATSDSYQLSNPANGTHTLKVVVSDSNTTVQMSWTVVVSEALQLNFTTPEKVETKSILTNQESVKSVCGNGIIESGEDCSTCIEDARCGNDEICLNAKCEKKKNGSLVFTIVLVIGGVIAGLVFILYKLNASRHPLDEHRGEDRPRKPMLSNHEVKPASEIKDFYAKRESLERSEKVESKPTSLRKEIAELRKTGMTDQDISSTLVAKGWPKWQIELRLKEK